MKRVPGRACADCVTAVSILSWFKLPEVPFYPLRFSGDYEEGFAVH